MGVKRFTNSFSGQPFDGFTEPTLLLIIPADVLPNATENVSVELYRL